MGHYTIRLEDFFFFFFFFGGGGGVKETVSGIFVYSLESWETFQHMFRVLNPISPVPK